MIFSMKFTSAFHNLLMGAAMKMSTTTAIALCIGLWLCGTAHGDYLAYAVGERSKLPLPESIDRHRGESISSTSSGATTAAGAPGWRCCRWTTPVPRRASRSSGGTAESVTWEIEHANQVPVNGIEAIITDVMNRTGRFRLVERQALDSVLREQDLVTSERVLEAVRRQDGERPRGEVLGAGGRHGLRSERVWQEGRRARRLSIQAPAGGGRRRRR